jgi:hypothetical protein
MNKFKCDKCGGKPDAPRCGLDGGSSNCPHDFPHCDMDGDCNAITDKDCPTCGSGYMALGVGTKCGGHPMKIDCTCKLAPECMVYRPLTDAEVEEIFWMHDTFNSKSKLSREQIMRLLIISVENGMAKYKGSPVTLIPWKER